jgi:hypothetical protein
LYNAYIKNSGHVESGEKGGSSEDDLGGTFFGSNWGITGEDISTIIRIGGGLVLSGTGSSGISSSWLKISAASTIWANFSEVLIGTDGLGLSGGDKSSDGGEFHFCFKLIYL